MLEFKIQSNLGLFFLCVLQITHPYEEPLVYLGRETENTNAGMKCREAQIV